MHSIHAPGSSLELRKNDAPCIPSVEPQPSDYVPSKAEDLGLEYVRTFPFAEDARVCGYLVQADVGPITYGHLYGADLPPDRNFVKMEAIGIDSRGGYDLVRSATGFAFVIVTYAPHAREKGLTHLKEHIGANPDYYAARALALSSPWPHGPAMIEQLKAAWERRLRPPIAQQRYNDLQLALAALKPA
jgi:hypothetical protein